MAERDDVLQDVDAVTFEVIGHRLLSITEDKAATLRLGVRLPVRQRSDRLRKRARIS